MIARLIAFSAANRFLVLLVTLMLAGIGVWSVADTPLDAMPDLSDVQVIIYTEYPGPGAADRRGPGHLSAHHGACLRVPQRQGGARLLVLRRLVRLRDLRGRHRPLLGALARARIPELGRQAACRRASRRRSGRTRPASAGSTSTSCSARSSTLGGAAQRSRTGSCATSSPRRRASPRSPASAASCKQYQVVVDPRRLHAYGIPLDRRSARRSAPATSDVGGRAIEMAETEYMVRGRGYLRGSTTSSSIVRQGRPGRHAGAAARRRARRARAGRAPRHRRAQRRGRGRRRHRVQRYGAERARRRSATSRRSSPSSPPSLPEGVDARRRSTTAPS